MKRTLKRIKAVFKTCGSETKCWVPTYKHFKQKEKYIVVISGRGASKIRALNKLKEGEQK